MDQKIMSNECSSKLKNEKTQEIFCSAVKPMKQLAISLELCKHMYQEKTRETGRLEKNL